MTSKQDIFIQDFYNNGFRNALLNYRYLGEDGFDEDKLYVSETNQLGLLTYKDIIKNNKPAILYAGDSKNSDGEDNDFYAYVIYDGKEFYFRFFPSRSDSSGYIGYAVLDARIFQLMGNTFDLNKLLMALDYVRL